MTSILLLFQGHLNGLISNQYALIPHQCLILHFFMAVDCWSIQMSAESKRGQSLAKSKKNYSKSLILFFLITTKYLTLDNTSFLLLRTITRIKALPLRLLEKKAIFLQYTMNRRDTLHHYNFHVPILVTDVSCKLSGLLNICLFEINISDNKHFL